MARIRTIKPEFPQSESMGRVSREARYCFIMLWTVADDSGRLRGNSRMLASLLFPYDDDVSGLIDGWLDELAAEGCIVKYQVDGNSYIQIANWLIHQKIDKPSQSKIPEFDESSRILANPLRRIKEGIKEGISKTTVISDKPEDDLLACPVEKLIEAYHELMPNNPRCKILNNARRSAIRQRWREAASLPAKPFGYSTTQDGVEAWRKFFAVCAESEFLTGRIPGRNGSPPFVADVDFLFSPRGFAKVLENKYHREAA